MPACLLTFALPSIRNDPVSKVSRPSRSPLIRLQRKIWAHRLRIDHTGGPESAKEPIGWAALERALLDQNAIAKACRSVMERPQTLFSVAEKGTDPRGVRRIPSETLTAADMQALASSSGGDSWSKERLPSGPLAADESRTALEYFEFPVDLVECAEQLHPGSGEWMKGHLIWTLTHPMLPPLDELREELARLKWSLRLRTPPPLQREAMTGEPAFLPLDQAAARYSESLTVLSRQADARSLSVLAGLIAESHIIGDETLLNIHKEHFQSAVDLLLDHEWMASLRSPFKRLVASRFIFCSWESPALQHRSSIHAPFVAVEDWERQTGVTGWRGHDW